LGFAIAFIAGTVGKGVICIELDCSYVPVAAALKAHPALKLPFFEEIDNGWFLALW
jgi:hypothetical protein